MLIWLLGQSGSGKTFFSKKIVKFLVKKKIKHFHLDGDDFRKYISYDLGYDKRSRYINGKRVFAFCDYLISKKFIVVLSMQSMFREMQSDNRRKIKKYLQFNLVSNFMNVKLRKKQSYILGKDLKFNPIEGDLNIFNERKSTQKNLNLMIKSIKKKFSIK
jgi:adenylylsulfate kinase-like enzyme